MFPAHLLNNLHFAIMSLHQYLVFQNIEMYISIIQTIGGVLLEETFIICPQRIFRQLS